MKGVNVISLAAFVLMFGISALFLVVLYESRKVEEVLETSF